MKLATIYQLYKGAFGGKKSMTFNNEYMETNRDTLLDLKRLKNNQIIRISIRFFQ